MPVHDLSIIAEVKSGAHFVAAAMQRYAEAPAGRSTFVAATHRTSRVWVVPARAARIWCAHATDPD